MVSIASKKKDRNLINATRPIQSIQLASKQGVVILANWMARGIRKFFCSLVHCALGPSFSLEEWYVMKEDEGED